MECFDISTMQGRHTVGSMAVLVDGEPVPAQYRHFRLRTLAGMDDFAALREVLARRLKRGVAEQLLPDLVIIDGGRGQLGVIASLLAELGLAQRIDAVGMAKSRIKANVRGKLVERSGERLFLAGRKNPVRLAPGSAALFLLERLRDEAHRFAITYHRKVRSSSQLSSVLADIAGIGPQRRRLLLRQFGSAGGVQQATLAELLAVPGLPAAVARRLHAHFHPDGS
jgi:excinuclease ABC subunit C